MKYEARLWARDWENGSGWVTAGEELESWNATEDLSWWKEAFANKNYSDLFEYIEPGCEESEDYNDVKYTIELVEIDTDDSDEGKTIAKLSIWGSELKAMREAD